MPTLHIADAQDELLRTPEVLADWINGECMNDGPLPAFARMGEKTPEDFARWSVGALLALAMHQNQPAKVIAAAMQAIGTRYLADPAIKTATQVVFARMETEQAEEEADLVDDFFNRFTDGVEA